MTIAAGDSLSDGIPVRIYDLTGIELPEGFEGSLVTFQAARQADGTYVDVHDETGDETIVVAGASRFIPLVRDELKGVRFLKVRAGMAVAPQVQAADRTIFLVGEGP